MLAQLQTGLYNFIDLSWDIGRSEEETELYIMHGV